MKKKFTFLMAALMLLTMMVLPGKAVGQTYEYNLVKSISDLSEGDVILITSGTDGDVKAMGTYSSGNNVPAVDISISEETISTLGSAQEVTLETQSTTSGHENYFTLKQATNQYFYAANTSSGKNNYLKTKNDDAVYWSIVINTTTYKATVIDQTSECNGRNQLRKNSQSAIFSCYASGQNDVYIFKKEETGGDLEDNDLALTGAPISLSFDFYDNYSAQQISYTTSSTGAVTVDASEYITATVNESTKIITIEPVKKTSGAQTITVRQAADDTYKAGSTTFTVTITDSTPVSWVETSLANLTSGDVFVIVGNNGSNYAMTNNNGASNPPAASAVTIEKVNSINEITSDVDDNILWNLVITDGGYVFYPAGYNDKWLYCTNNNNGVRVGTGEAKHFTINSDYLYMTETSDNRYIGIYNSQDWRCYTSINSNIENQTFAFYKKVYDNNSSYSTSITGCGTGTDNNVGYYLIASPVISVDPTTSNFLNNLYDLYYFDQSYEGSEWKNYKANSFNLYTGKGYLYANSDNVELTFTGQPYNGNGVVGLKYDSENTPYFIGWNLIGNPYSTTAYLPKDYAFYRMKSDHTELEAVTNVAISAMEGVFVKVNDVNQTVTFTTTAPAKGWTAGSKVVINVTDNKGNFIDRAIVRFDEGNTLPKFMLNDKNTKVYIPREDDDYAVINSDGKDNIPVNFKPATTGKYTLTVDTEGIDMNYLHLIDRFTGEDIDLLMDNTYSFVGSQIDNDSRFILSFTAKGYNVTSDEPFAYQSGSDIIVDGNGELQIFDVTGRKVMTTTINGVQTLNSLNTGFYIFRLNEKTQKIVVR